MAEKFSLKWNDFQDNVSKTFKKLRSTDHFYDVTLVSDDQQQMSAHKVVLASCSEYFKNVLTSNKHSNPMLCLSGVTRDDLQNMLDYIYYGEIQIYQDNLDAFLDIAQRFQLEGLMQGKDEPIHDTMNEDIYDTAKIEARENDTMVAVNTPTNKNIQSTRRERIISVESANYGSIEDLDQKVEEMIEKLADGSNKCITCGKVSKNRGHIKEHVEVHFDGLSFPCQYCWKSFRSRHSLRTHIRACLRK